MLEKLLEGLSRFWNDLYHSDFPETLVITLKIIAAIFLASVLLYFFAHLLTYFVKVAKQLSKRLIIIFGILLFILTILVLINPNRECFLENEEFFLSCRPKVAKKIDATPQTTQPSDGTDRQTLSN